MLGQYFESIHFWNSNGPSGMLNLEETFLLKGEGEREGNQTDGSCASAEAWDFWDGLLTDWLLRFCWYGSQPAISSAGWWIVAEGGHDLDRSKSPFYFVFATLATDILPLPRRSFWKVSPLYAPICGLIPIDPPLFCQSGPVLQKKKAKVDPNAEGRETAKTNNKSKKKPLEKTARQKRLVWGTWGTWWSARRACTCPGRDPSQPAPLHWSHRLPCLQGEDPGECKGDMHWGNLPYMQGASDLGIHTSLIAARLLEGDVAHQCKFTGCAQEMTLEDLELHEKICQYPLVSCPCSYFVSLRSLQSLHNHGLVCFGCFHAVSTSLLLTCTIRPLTSLPWLLKRPQEAFCPLPQQHQSTTNLKQTGNLSIISPSFQGIWKFTKNAWRFWYSLPGTTQFCAFSFLELFKFNFSH